MLSLRLPVVFFVWINMFFVAVYGHGLMVDPPGRSSMWRFGFDTPVNYDDSGLNCGHQHQPLDFLSGKCGLCGDPLDQDPKKNEAGGTFATGIISKNYNKAAIITIKIQLNANHKGFFEFRLCENNDVTKRITRACLKHLLVNPETGETRYPVAASAHYIEVSAKLPANVTCSQCVLQWRYRTGNARHYAEDDCEICGDQEEFYACSDIAITDTDVPTTTLKAGTTAAGTDVTVVPTTSTTTASPTTSSTSTTTPSTTAAQTTIPPTSKAGGSCVSLLKGIQDSWCVQNCNHSPSFCPIFLCKC